MLSSGKYVDVLLLTVFEAIRFNDLLSLVDDVGHINLEWRYILRSRKNIMTESRTPTT